MLTASKSCCKFTIFEVSGCLSLSHSLTLSYYLSCILFLFGSLLLCILLLLLFFVLSLKFFPLHVANCHDLRPVPLHRVSVHAAYNWGQQIVPIFGTIFCHCFLPSVFANLLSAFRVFYLALQQLRLVAFGLSTVLLRSGQIVYLPFIFIVPVIQIVYTVYSIYIPLTPHVTHMSG